jgi:hypothetical protein
MKGRDRLIKEIKRCAADFDYFSKKYLKIVDKNGRMILLRPNNAQQLYLEADNQNPWVYILKARKLGMTTVIAAYNFWSALFTRNYSVLVLAHTDLAAKGIFQIYRRFYDNLPEFLQFEWTLLNKHELRFKHGGYINAATAGSESARGQTYQSIHCSEFAMYEDIESLIASALSTAGNNARVVLETTANGLNEAHKIWTDENGFEKLFISWMDAEDTKRFTKPKWVPKQITELASSYKLSKQQLYWAAETFATKCAANWNTFMQEYPPEAHLAFITSGKRFFNRSYPHVKSTPGKRTYQEPLKFRAYVMGVDVASGSEHGDYSAYCMLDCTNRRKPEIVSVFYEKVAPAEFAEEVLKEAEKYHALVCVESNSYGLSVIEYLIGKEYVHMYRRVKYDSARNRYTENLGFNTNKSTRSVLMARIQEYISREWLRPIDSTLQSEINSFVFSRTGKPEAESGKHDDLIMATALALVSMDQVDPEEEVKSKDAPANLAEMLQFELQTGRLYSKNEHLFDQDPLLDKPLAEAPLSGGLPRF